jgi:hypothetical protein
METKAQQQQWVKEHGAKEIGERGANAQISFVEMVQEQFGFTKTEAGKIWTVYRKCKVVKIDWATGRFQVTHGAYWEKEPMVNALAM